jgi:hypothetical protein
MDDMLTRTLLFLSLVAVVGCSSLAINDLRGTMDRINNERYGYALLIPKDWSTHVNSNIRPTQLEIKAADMDAAIIVMVAEGGKAMDLEKYVESRSHQKNTEAFALMRKWREHFDDYTGYVLSFTWKGVMRFGDADYGKAGQEYQASVAVVDRDPSPITLVCFAPKDKFAELNVEFFGHAQDSLKVQPVEITVRKVEE